MNITNIAFNGEPVRGVCDHIHWVVPSPAPLGCSFAEFEAAREAINHPALEQENWDGYGALAITKEIKGNALSMLARFETTVAAPEVTPNPNGTISLVWETSKGYGHLEIGRTRYSFYVQPSVGDVISNDGDTDRVNPAVGSLVDALLYPKPSHSITQPFNNV